MSNGINRLSAVFSDDNKVLVPYITAGDPNLNVTYELLCALADNGADIIELGIPFSDPMADGPVLQEAAERALMSPIDLDQILDVASKFSDYSDVPIILFGYYNPFFRYGHERLARAMVNANVCGVLCVDLPPEEAEPFHTALTAHGLALIPLLTPTSDSGRIQSASQVASAFGYYVSVTGVTGASLDGRGSISERVKSVREQFQLPIVVGFGVRTPEDAKRMSEGADGVVVGSALVDMAHRAEPSERIPSVSRYVAGLKAAIQSAK